MTLIFFFFFLSFHRWGDCRNEICHRVHKKQQCFPELQSRAQHVRTEQTGWSVLLRLKDGFTTEKKPGVYKPVCDPVVPPAVVFSVTADLSPPGFYTCGCCDVDVDNSGSYYLKQKGIPTFLFKSSQ